MMRKKGGKFRDELYIMKEDSEREFLEAASEKEEGEEEVQQLNTPRPVVNAEWGGKTMGPLILRSLSSSLTLHFSAK